LPWLPDVPSNISLLPNYEFVLAISPVLRRNPQPKSRIGPHRLLGKGRLAAQLEMSIMAGNSLLTISMITREAIELFVNT